MQWRGTYSVGRIFGPVMAAWFLIIGVLGVKEIVFHPYVLLAISQASGRSSAFSTRASPRRPRCGGAVRHRGRSVVPRLGHFGPQPIRRTWTWFRAALPGADYFGQGALTPQRSVREVKSFLPAQPALDATAAGDPGDGRDRHCHQAVISGAYSMTRSGMQLGFLPRMNGAP